jgi:hypothetical protein
LKYQNIYSYPQSYSSDIQISTNQQALEYQAPPLAHNQYHPSVVHIMPEHVEYDLDRMSYSPYALIMNYDDFNNSASIANSAYNRVMSTNLNLSSPQQQQQQQQQTSLHDSNINSMFSENMVGYIPLFSHPRPVFNENNSVYGQK